MAQPFPQAPNEYGIELDQLARRRKMAEMLRAQSMDPLQSQTAGGFVVPISPFQGLAKMAQAYAGRKADEKVDADSRALMERSRSDLVDVLRRSGEAARGAPGRDYGTDALTGEGMSAPAIPADPQRSAEILMSNQQTQALGMQQYQQAQRTAKLAEFLRMAQGGGTGATPGAGSVAAPGASGGAAGGFPGVSPAALAASMDPDTAELAKLIQGGYTEANKPIVARENAPILRQDANGVPRVVFQPAPKLDQGQEFNFDTRTVSPAAGYIPTMQAIEGAKADVSAARDIVNVNMGDGTTRQMPRAEFLRMQRGGAPAPAPAPMAPAGPTTPTAAPPGGWQVPPDVQQQRDATAARLKQEEAARIAAAEGRPAPAAPPAGFGVTPSEGQRRADTEIGEGTGKRYVAIQDGGLKANSKISSYRRLGQLLDSIDTGKLTPAGTELAAWAKAAGLNVGGDNVANAQAAKAISNEMALQMRDPSGGAGMPGALSDGDRAMLQSMIANIDKTPGANKLLIEGAIKLAQREREVAAMARDYRKRNGRFDEGFYDELQRYSDANPLFARPQAAPRPAAVRPGEVVGRIRNAQPQPTGQAAAGARFLGFE